MKALLTLGFVARTLLRSTRHPTRRFGINKVSGRAQSISVHAARGRARAANPGVFA
jgi:hypothetical protein